MDNEGRIFAVYSIKGKNLNKLYELIESAMVCERIRSEDLLKASDLNLEDFQDSCGEFLLTYERHNDLGYVRKIELVAFPDEGSDSLNKVVQKAIFEKFDCDIKYFICVNGYNTTNCHKSGLYEIGYYLEDSDTQVVETFKVCKDEDKMVKHLQNVLNTSIDDLDELINLAESKLEDFDFIKYEYDGTYFNRH